jgi:ferredoxin-NADP reductase/predicted pyridoxine 5'-phosphate oxidase superfamily flavin-nucleotide-binding protein
MGHRFAALAFTDSVREVQRSLGSRAGYASMDEGSDYNHVLGEREAAFIAARDSFYMATVGETGWPYVQHRGGPAGFVRILDERTIGFADFRGNRQYVSVGNLRKDDRVALFFMDYPNRTRLKLLGRVRLVGGDQAGLLARLEVAEYRAAVERGFVVRIEAFDWNCAQHITPRYTEAEVEALVAPVLEENRKVKAAGRAVPEAPPAALGQGPLELVISGVRRLTPRIRAYELRDPEGGELPALQAGAHLEVPVQLENGKTATRRYSIASDPVRRDAYEIAVLREDAGTGGSRAVHESFALGLRLRCGLPRNDFALHDDARPAMLIAGGIGITPIKAMAHALRQRGSDVRLHYAARSAAEAAYRDELAREFGDSLHLHLSSDGQRINIEALLAAAPADALFYVCGPHRLVDAVAKGAEALGIDPARIRVERFAASIAPDARPLEVELRRSGRTLRVAADQTVLDAALAAGVAAPFGCRAGHCRTCAVEVLEGEPEHRDTALSPAEREQQHLMCPCISRAQGERLVLDL